VPDAATLGTEVGAPRRAVTDRVRLPTPSLAHLDLLTTQIGVWEHARFSTPRPEHGTCTDDNARALVVACRQSGGARASRIATMTLGAVLDARDPDGRVRNRRRADGTWLERPRSEDAEGRTLWALGTAVRRGPSATIRHLAATAFGRTAEIDAAHVRPHAAAVFGATEVLSVMPAHPRARRALELGVERLVATAAGRDPWIAPRLTYEDARIPEALLAAAAFERDPDLRDLGLDLLEWLVHDQTLDGRFSFTPAGGRAPGGPRPAFDQQPVEAAAMAEACARAWALTAAPAWRGRARRAVAWFVGENDVGANLYDAATGATFDGLERKGVNRNQGAESTIAGIAAMQVGRATVAGARAASSPWSGAR
jgi:hypothetical protein